MPNTPLKGDYNTYIGARYVPIIGGMWNQQTEYEPLTIVMYQGSSYTSKTFVPKGTQIDNTTYWVRTANYDEQVEFYRSEVQQFKKDIDASEAEYIATVQKAQNDYENKLTDRQNKYETKTTADLTAIANSATAPIFVSTTDEMTDNTKIYVLKTNGHIYAYNGTTIADTSLTYPDYDSIFLIKGEATADLNDETVAGVYKLGNSTAHTNVPDNYAGGLLTVFKNGDYEIVQTFYGLNKKGAEASSTKFDMYVRHMYFNFSEKLSGWTPWQKVAYNNNIYVSTLAGGSVGYRVSFGKYTLDIVHVVDTSTNSDLWNLQNITCDDTIIMQSGTDILGPILISGENNFSGGVHGNEKVKIINILADGKEIKPGAFNDIIINMCSDLYTPSDQSTKFATRYINISITKNKIHVASNIIISKDNLTVERATNSGLFSIKNDVTGIYLQNYVATKDNLPTNGVNVVSKYNIDSILCWKGGAIEIKTIHGNENSTYKGQLAVFTNETPIRYKVYHDTLTNTKVNSGDNIYGEFEYIFY